jgi:hypothetical protein
MSRIVPFGMMGMGLVLALVAALAGCSVDGQAWTGAGFDDAPLDLHSADEGVWPDRSVLADPRNPFRDGPIGEQTIWQIQSNGGPVAAFYAWATACARGATGERQFYAALNLKSIYEAALAVDDDMPLTRELAIRGFQVVLDHFPTSVTYDATGTIAYDLATPSVEAILALGGKVQGGWVIVTTEGGGKKAVRP